MRLNINENLKTDRGPDDSWVTALDVTARTQPVHHTFLRTSHRKQRCRGKRMTTSQPPSPRRSSPQPLFTSAAESGCPTRWNPGRCFRCPLQRWPRRTTAKQPARWTRPGLAKTRLSQVPPQARASSLPPAAVLPSFPPGGPPASETRAGYRLGWGVGPGAQGGDVSQQEAQPAGSPRSPGPRQAAGTCSRHGLPLICSFHQPDRTCCFYFLFLKMSGHPVIPFPGSQGSYGYFILLFCRSGNHFSRILGGSLE